MFFHLATLSTPKLSVTRKIAADMTRKSLTDQRKKIRRRTTDEMAYGQSVANPAIGGRSCFYKNGLWANCGLFRQTRLAILTRFCAGGPCGAQGWIRESPYKKAIGLTRALIYWSVHASNVRWQKHLRCRLPIVTEFFFQSMHLVRAKGFPTVFKSPISVNAFSSYVGAEKVGGSVGYIHTRPSTGLVVNNCTVAMSPKGKSRGTWCFPENFFICHLSFWS